MHCHHMQHLGRGSGESAKMLYLDILEIFLSPRDPKRHTNKVLPGQLNGVVHQLTRNHTPKAEVWAMLMQGKAHGDMAGESLYRERVNCITFPTSSAKSALHEEKLGGTVLYFLGDIFSPHEKRELFSPGIFTSKLSLWNKFSAADSNAQCLPWEFHPSYDCRIWSLFYIK